MSKYRNDRKFCTLMGIGSILAGLFIVWIFNSVAGVMIAGTGVGFIGVAGLITYIIILDEEND